MILRMERKHLTVFTCALLLPLLTGCDHLGRALLKSGHSYRNDNGIVVKYTGNSKDFTDTFRQQQLQPFEALAVKHGIKVEWVPSKNSKLLVLGGYDAKGQVVHKVEENQVMLRPSDQMMNSNAFIRNLKVQIHAPAPFNLNVDQFGMLQLSDTLRVKALSVKVDEHGFLEGSIETDSLDAVIRDHSELKLKGGLKSADLMVRKHSETSIGNFKGNGKIQLKASRHSDIGISGQASAIKASLENHSLLEATDLKSQKGRIALNKHSEGELGVERKLWADCQHHSNLSVQGTPTVVKRTISRHSRLRVDTSGASYP